MLFGGLAEDTVVRHIGYVAGRYRDGSRSDIWTDVRRCAYATFVRYVAACECGWYGKDHPATAAGYKACACEWTHEHHTATPEPIGLEQPPATAGDQSVRLRQAV
jgi:hypothetical protein